MKKIFLTSIFLSLICFWHGLHALTVNIISHSLDNGAGKEVDVAILKEELENMGHLVLLNDYFKVKEIEPADINIFLAQVKSEWFKKGKLNWFIPNPECCDVTLEEIAAFDLVICKTKETLKIFSPLAKKVFYLGFTSIDRYEPSIQKDYHKYLHAAGKSRMKGSGSLYKVWKSHSNFPLLTLIWHRRISEHLKFPKNMQFINQRIPLESLIELQNHCGVHVCPSKAEGFGHYIMEAMSAEAVVVTTNAPPMNEFIKDPRCLVKVKKSDRKKYASIHYVDEKALAKTIERLQKLPEEELRAIGQRNREEYLHRKAKFKQKLEVLMQAAE